MLTTFWDLCSDVILEVCDYLSVNELFFSFYPDVLPGLFELLTISHINLHFSLTCDDLHTATILSLINVDQVISLHISSCDNIPSNIFNAVKTLTLENFSDENNILSQPSFLPSLQHLILIYSDHVSYQAENAIRNAFLRPALKYLKLHLTTNYLLSPTNSLGQSFSIEQLIVHASCSKLALKSIIDSLPCLRILRTRTLIGSQSTMARNQPRRGINIMLPPVTYHSSLQIIDLVWYHADMSSLTIFLIALPNLKRCRLSGVMNPKELNGILWYDLLTKTCKNLTRMIVNMLIWTGIQTKEIKTNFDEDIYFKDINFKLKLSDRENELLILIGDFKRSV
jgi:hypothetical protein